MQISEEGGTCKKIEVEWNPSGVNHGSSQENHMHHMLPGQERPLNFEIEENKIK